MVETKNVKDVKFTLEKQKGLYSGQIISGKLTTTPEGYGKLIFKDGTILDGRFKEGNFVSGKAISPKGDVFEGEFDNLKWISGTISYKNGDFLEGSLSQDGNLDVTKFRITQQFNDVFEGEAVNKDGQTEIVGTQTFVDKSTLKGTFLMRKPNSNGEDFEKKFVENKTFGVVKPVFKCLKGQAEIKLFEDEENPSNYANLVGEFEDGKIKGVLSLSQESFQNILTGDFSFSRKKQLGQTFHNVSEDFGDFFLQNEAITPYAFNIVMTNGDISMVDGTESFKATKHVDKQGHISYHGTFLSSRFKQSIVGNFFDDLSIDNAKILIDNTNNKIVGTLVKNGNSYSFSGEQSFLNGDFKKGKFKSEVKFDKNQNGMPKQLFVKNDFVSGNFRQTVKNENYDNLVFEGKTRDLVTKEDGSHFDITTKPSIFEKQNAEISSFGTLVGKKDGKQILLKNGLFDSNFELLEGHIEEEITANDEIVTAIGEKKFNAKKEERFFGKTSCSPSGDWFDGEFLMDYTFVCGNVKVHLENNTVFEGKTNDCKDFEGRLERKNDFWQEGLFETNPETNMIDFVKGKTLVFFDRTDQAKCFAHFDKSGFKDFGDKKYLCIISNNKTRQTVDMFATDSVSDAMAEFDKKLLGERLIAKTTPIYEQVKQVVESDLNDKQSKTPANNTLNLN